MRFKEPYILSNLKSFWIDYARRNYKGRLPKLREALEKSNIGIIFEIYLGRLFYFSTLAFVAAFVYSLVTLIQLGIHPISTIVLALAISAFGAGIVALVFYSYPNYLITSKRKSIETNLPFAANHMGALAASGVPPHLMFKMLTDVAEYGEIAGECSRIVRNIELFGMDLITSVRNVAKRTPSEQFRIFLSGIVATITTGGDLRAYLKTAASEALSDYRLRRERYIANLATYADFYVGVLIAAPLFFISILSLLAIVGGQIAGFSLPSLLLIGIFIIIPLLNIAFLMFVHFTQPSV